MSFLFKSKKQPPPSALPPATRNIHTSDGTPSSAAPNGVAQSERSAISPPPAASATGQAGSISSLNSSITTAPNGQFPRRERSESEAGTRPTNPNMMTQVPNAALYPWSQRRLNFPTPQSNPFPRYGAAVNSVASKEGDIYMMGGLINGSTVRGDLWMVESTAATLSCYPIATVSEGPGPRVGHASLLVGNAFIVFGGDTKMDDSDVLDDTLYLLNTSSRQWSRASPPGARPPGRYGHTLNILGSKIYIFGGQVEGYFFNDLLAFDLNALQNPTNTWDFLMPNTGDDDQPNSPRPAPRTNHSMISYNDQMYLFGGTNGSHWFNDVWTFDPKACAWTQLDCIGYIPAPREGHSAALVNDVMYVFGGRTEEGTDLGDLAAFRISSRRWYTFQNMGPSPSPRSGHSMTAHNKQIVVLAGEPSSATPDRSELSMVYVLDTAKIRYPNDAPAVGADGKQPNSPTRRPSTEARLMGPPNKRSTSREGQAPQNAYSRSIEAPTGGPVQRPDQSGSPRPRASVTAPSGPPPQAQAPNPRTNGVTSPEQQARQAPVQAPVVAPIIQAPTAKEAQKENIRTGTSREPSPGHQGRRTPTQQMASKARSMEAGEAAPIVSSGVARQRSQRSQRGQGSIDSTEEGALGRSSSSRHQSDTQNSMRSFADEPRSPKLNAHQEALVKELETTKRTNAWYASELALAKKAGYLSGASSSPTFDDRAMNQFSDEDRPLIEAFMTMRSEMVKMHQAMEYQSSSTAKRIAEIEHSRNAAVTEAAYARAKLAAHGGSQRSTPQLDSHDDSERSTDISRRLALALAASNEHKSKIDLLTNDLNTERKAREAAEEAAEAAHQRLDGSNASHNPADLEALRADLHEAQGEAREESTQRAESEEKLRMLQIEHGSLSQKHEGVSARLKEHLASVAALEAAVGASKSKSDLYERQIEQERSQRETAENKLQQLRAEHEERTSELESTSRRLRDVEELSDTHAKEASTHREALMAGLARLSSPEPESSRDSMIEQRAAAHQESAERANALARKHQTAADTAAQKLRAAEERIAGLEAYQEQSSREGLQIRRQLQTTLRESQSHQNELRELRGDYESHQREHSALAVQHGALKDLLGERGMGMSDTRRSPTMDSPASRFGTPEQTRLRELESQLQNSQKSHEETKSQYETRMQEADGTYREKLEQLENDYQSAVHYVKGTEKMLKKMKEELTKYKSVNSQLQTELESSRGGAASAASVDSTAWTSERESLQHSIDEIKTQMSSQVSALETNLASVQRELGDARDQHDKQQAEQEELVQYSVKTGRELESLKSENAMLQSQVEEAEKRVTMLLDQVGTTVTNYRRQSQIQPVGPNGIPSHNREPSASTMTDTSSHQGDDAKGDERGSVALDHLASELETLRSQWETTARNNYRLSNAFDFERTPTREHAGGPSELTDSLADWRRRLDEEERTGEPGPASPTHAAEGVSAHMAS